MAENGKLNLYWIRDLGGPNEEGKYFARQGQRVLVTDADVQMVQKMVRAGARDVLFEALRTDGHYELGGIVATN
jgi:hypothetical protein